MPDKISDQVAYLEAHPEITLVHSNSIKVDAVGRNLKNIDYSNRVNSGNVFAAIVQGTGGINTPSHLYRTSIYGEIGYYDPSFTFEDTDFWLRLTRNHLVGFINKFHTCYRWHGSNLSHSRNALAFYHEQVIRIFKKNIDDQTLLKQGIRRILRKSISKSLRLWRLKDAWTFFLRFARPG